MEAHLLKRQTSSDLANSISLAADAANDDPELQTADKPEVSDVMTMDTEPPVVSHEDVLLLTWSRAAGALKHDDTLSITVSGRVTATARNASMDETVVRGTLSEEQLTTMTAWVDQHATFTRREMDSERAVRTTILQGRGEVIPSAELQAEIAGYAAAAFLGLTESE